MILNSLFNNKINTILKKVMDCNVQKHAVITNNIANIETPGFTAKRFEFEEALQNAVHTGNIDIIQNASGEVVNNYDNPYRMDMNNVDIEKELLSMEENRMQYETIGTLLKKKLLKWNKIIEGVKG